MLTSFTDFSFQLKKLFKVKWKDERNPVQGFEFLYLNDVDLEKVKGLVATERVNNYNKITGIIGKEVFFAIYTSIIATVHHFDIDYFSVIWELKTWLDLV